MQLGHAYIISQYGQKTTMTTGLSLDHGNLNHGEPRCVLATPLWSAGSVDSERRCEIPLQDIKNSSNSHKEHTSFADMSIMMMSLVVTQPSIQLAGQFKSFVLTTKLVLQDFPPSPGDVFLSLSYISHLPSPHCGLRSCRPKVVFLSNERWSI